MVVMEKTVVVFGRFFLQRWNCRAVDYENVQPAVIVVINQPDAGDHGLRLVLVGSWRTVRGEVQAGAARHVFKANGGVGCVDVGVER